MRAGKYEGREVKKEAEGVGAGRRREVLNGGRERASIGWVIETTLFSVAVPMELKS